MAFIHANNIIHRDLKPANILIDAHWNAKICDFGLSDIKKNFEIKSNGKGSVPWMAPETISGEGVDYRTDVYAIGIIIWQIFTTEFPYPLYLYIKDSDDAILKLKKNVAIHGLRPDIDKESIPDSIKKLIVTCWSHKQEDRPYLHQVISVLDSAWIDTLITDPLANSFWKQNYLGKDFSSWKQFSVDFCDFLIGKPKDVDYTLKDRKYQCLEKIVATENKNPGEDKFVTLEQFAHVINWFGPISSMDKEDFVDTMKDIMKEHWFWGDISYEEAENMLPLSKIGLYLVRASKNNPKQPFTISYVALNGTSGEVNHLRIDKLSNGFGTLTKNQTGSVVLVKSTLTLLIAALKDPLHLTEPVACSKYLPHKDPNYINKK